MHSIRALPSASHTAGIVAASAARSARRRDTAGPHDPSLVSPSSPARVAPARTAAIRLPTLASAAARSAAFVSRGAVYPSAASAFVVRASGPACAASWASTDETGRCTATVIVALVMLAGIAAAGRPTTPHVTLNDPMEAAAAPRGTPRRRPGPECRQTVTLAHTAEPIVMSVNVTDENVPATAFVGTPSGAGGGKAIAVHLSAAVNQRIKDIFMFRKITLRHRCKST